MTTALGADIIRDLEHGRCDLHEMYGIVSLAVDCANLQITEGTATEDFINAMGLLQIALRDRVFHPTKAKKTGV